MSTDDNTKTKTKTRTTTDNWDFAVSESSIELALKKEKKEKEEKKEKSRKAKRLRKLELEERPKLKNITREQMFYELQGERDLADLNVYAPLFQRAIAFVIDTVFLFLQIVIAKKTIFINYYLTSIIMNRYHYKWTLPFQVLDKIMWGFNLFLLVNILIVIPICFYYVSLGKKLMGIYVRGEDQFSLPIEVVFIREMVLKPISFFSIIGAILPFLNEKKKSLHDFILKTIVVLDD